MKYLIVLDGEYIHIVNSKEELQKFLYNEKEKMENRGVKGADEWFKDMQNYGFTHRFTTYPEIVLPLDETDIKIFQKAIDK